MLRHTIRPSRSMEPIRQIPYILRHQMGRCLALRSTEESRMSEETAKLSGPDLTQGVEFAAIPDGTMLLGHAQGEPVLLARRGDEVFAIGAICTHYGAPLEQGLLD